MTYEVEPIARAITVDPVRRLQRRKECALPAAAPAAMADLPLLRKTRHLFDKARDLRSRHLYPYFRTITANLDTEVVIDGARVLMFGSNSYLGLTNHPEIKKSVAAAVQKYGSGCAGSRFLNGTLDIHLQLEDALAELVGKEAAIVFATGFQANLGALAALVGRNEVVLADKEDHASIVDGCRLSFGTFQRWGHNDLGQLAERLRQIDPETGKLIVVDGVFSMSGDIAPLPGIVDLAQRHRAAVMVDDAHGIGVMGAAGAGSADHFGLTDRVHVIMGTFSKSLASVGGFLAADAVTIEFLKHSSRSLIFSASISPANTAAVLAALKIMRGEPERIERLWQNTQHMREGLERLGFETGTGQTPIIPVYCRESEPTMLMAMRLQAEGIFVNPVLPPGVQPHQSLIRISLMATHTKKQIDTALEKMAQVGAELGII